MRKKQAFILTYHFAHDRFGIMIQNSSRYHRHYGISMHMLVVCYTANGALQIGLPRRLERFKE